MTDEERLAARQRLIAESAALLANTPLDHLRGAVTDALVARLNAMFRSGTHVEEADIWAIVYRGGVIGDAIVAAARTARSRRMMVKQIALGAIEVPPEVRDRFIDRLVDQYEQAMIELHPDHDPVEVRKGLIDGLRDEIRAIISLLPRTDDYMPKPAN